jgi:hypothetical protein
MAVRDVAAEEATDRRASQERAAREEAVVPEVADAAAKEEKVVKLEKAAREEKAARGEKAPRAREESAAEVAAAAVVAVALKVATDPLDSTKATKSVSKDLPEEKDSRAALRAKDRRAVCSVVREAAVVASVEVVAATEAVISLLLIPAELRSFPSVVRDAEASEVAVAVVAKALLSEAKEERAARDNTTTLPEDTMTATALREVARDAEETAAAPEARPEVPPRALTLEVLLL